MEFDLLNANWNQLKDKTDSGKNNTYQPDPRFWKLVEDASKKEAGGTFMFVIDPNTKLPFVTLYSAQARAIGPGGKPVYMLDYLRSSIGLPDPINQWWEYLYNAGYTETSRTFARRQKNIANVYVMSDFVTKSNSGKLLLYEFGTQLREFFISQMEDENDENRIEVFNMSSGSYVYLKKNCGGDFPNYNASQLKVLPEEKRPSREQLMTLLKQAHDLNEFLKEDFYPTYFKQLEKLMKFMPFSKPNRAEIEELEYKRRFLDFVESDCLPELSSDGERDIIAKLGMKILKRETKPSYVGRSSSDDDSQFSKKPEKPSVKKEDDLPFDIDDEDLF